MWWFTQIRVYRRNDYEKERFLAIIEQELEYREKMRNKKFGEFGRRSDEREEDDKQKDHIETNDDEGTNESNIYREVFVNGKYARNEAVVEDASAF